MYIINKGCFLFKISNFNLLKDELSIEEFDEKFDLFVFSKFILSLLIICFSFLSISFSFFFSSSLILNLIAFTFSLKSKI